MVPLSYALQHKICFNDFIRTRCIRGLPNRAYSFGQFDLKRSLHWLHGKCFNGHKQFALLAIRSRRKSRRVYLRLRKQQKARNAILFMTLSIKILTLSLASGICSAEQPINLIPIFRRAVRWSLLDDGSKSRVNRQQIMYYRSRRS